jgi:hypothetical protein
LERYDERNQARVAIELAATANRLGRHELALEQFQAAETHYRKHGDRTGLIAALLGAADEAEGLGRLDLVRVSLEKVEQLYTQTADETGAMRIRARITELPGDQ